MNSDRGQGDPSCWDYDSLQSLQTLPCLVLSKWQTTYLAPSKCRTMVGTCVTERTKDKLKHWQQVISIKSRYQFLLPTRVCLFSFFLVIQSRQCGCVSIFPRETELCLIIIARLIVATPLILASLQHNLSFNLLKVSQTEASPQLPASSNLCDVWYKLCLCVCVSVCQCVFLHALLSVAVFCCSRHTALILPTCVCDLFKLTNIPPAVCHDLGNMIDPHLLSCWWPLGKQDLKLLV